MKKRNLFPTVTIRWGFLALILGVTVLLNYLHVGTVLLALILLASLFIKRFFCKYLCPAGALYAIFGKPSPLKIVRDPDACINCKATKKCPMDLEIHNKEAVTSSECISCNRCVDVCPAPGIMISTSFAGFELNRVAAVLISTAVFFGSIYTLDAAGLYKVSLPTMAEIQEKGEYLRLVDLRGSMTIEQGALYTGKELAEFYELMDIPAEVPKDTLM